MSLCPCRTAKGHFFFALRDMRAAPMNAGGQFYAENKSVSCIRRSSPCWSTGPAGRCFNRGRLQRCGVSKGYRFAHSNQAFYPMVKFP